MKISLIYIAATLIAGSIHAQTSGLLQQYRSKVEEYIIRISVLPYFLHKSAMKSRSRQRLISCRR